jgi:hypothetical protein
MFLPEHWEAVLKKSEKMQLDFKRLYGDPSPPAGENAETSG